MDRFMNQIPVTDCGLIIDQFVSGRIAAGIAPHGGLTYISFNGRKIFSGNAEAAFMKLLRVQVVIDGKPYYFETHNSRYYPFGYRSECTLEDVRLQYDMALDHDVLMQRIIVLDNPKGHEVSSRLLLHKACAKIDWEIMPGGSMVGETGVPAAIVCSAPCCTDVRNREFKYYMEAQEQNAVFAVVMGKSKAAIADIAAGLTDRLEGVFEEAQKKIIEGIQFSTGSDVLDSALNNAMPTLDALAVRDTPGAVRASQHYWIWGWDSMVHAEAYLWSGRAYVVRDMLDFYRETAHPEKGIGHSFTTDYQTDMIMPACSQGLYVVMLHNYYAATGDVETVLRNLPFAQKVLAMSKAAIHPTCNLGTGIGLFPDYPGLLEQTSGDISLMNNSLYLQALRCMSALETELGLSEAEECAKEADVLQADMERLLWDERVQYWADSLDGKELTPRPYHPLYGQLYVSPFGTCPREGEHKAIAEYAKLHFLFNEGLYMYAPDEAGFMADGNQLGAYYPTVDRYYWNIMNAIGDDSSGDDYRRIVERFWREHTYPEGLTHETVNADPTSDNPGCKQAFAIKAWFCDALELHLGLRVYVDGFRCHPLNTGLAFRVDGLTLRGHSLCLERMEDGVLKLNGKEMHQRKIRWSELPDFE